MAIPFQWLPLGDEAEILRLALPYLSKVRQG
jgi:hypothetical protein